MDTDPKSASGDPVPAGSEARARRLDATEVKAFVEDELLSPRRLRPIVAITTLLRSEATLLDADVAARRLSGGATVVVLATGRATRALTALLPPRLDVFGGWLRLWWPRITEGSGETHPLFPVADRRDAERALDAIEELLRAADGSSDPRSSAATIARVETRFAEVDVGGRTAVLRGAALRRHRITFARDAFRVGQRVRVRSPRPARDGQLEVELVWRGPRGIDRLFALLACNDVVRARVIAPPSRERGLHVELLPGCNAVVPVFEIPPAQQEQPDLAVPGRVVLVRVVDFSRNARRIDLSMHDVPSSRLPTIQYSLFEEGPLFLDDAASDPLATDLESARRRAEAELREMRSSLAAAEGDVTRLRHQFDQLRDERTKDQRTIEHQTARIRGFIEKLRDRASGDAVVERRVLDEADDAAASALLRERIEGSCLAHSTEADRRERPPLPFRFGSRFLSTLRELQGVSERKVVDVCAEVLLGVADRKAGRETHPLGEGAAHGAQLVRSLDGAKAWRCALQVKTPSARRLHWWRLANGGVEFASVSRHDDFTIPD